MKVVEYWHGTIKNIDTTAMYHLAGVNRAWWVSWCTPAGKLIYSNSRVRGKGLLGCLYQFIDK